mgnify:CR=1 FL=1
MSLPSFPNIDPLIKREDAVNQILSSIAMEELGMSHILNAEGEKLQYILGTLPGLSGPAATVKDVLNANESVKDLLEATTQNQLLLRSKMQCALDTTPAQGPAGPAGPAGPNVTATHTFATNYTGGTVLPDPLRDGLLGVTVPLPNVGQSSTKIDFDKASSEFISKIDGYFQISYHLNPSTPLVGTAQIVINNEINKASVMTSQLAANHFSGTILTPLHKGDRVSLRMISAAPIVLPAQSAGASLLLLCLG